MVRLLLHRALRWHGFEVLLADSGSAAVRLFEAHRGRISCILLDVRMPGLDGPQTLRALRHLDPSVVCCFMSGHAGDHPSEELLALGAARWPSAPPEILAVFEAPGAIVRLPRPRRADARPAPPPSWAARVAPATRGPVGFSCTSFRFPLCNHRPVSAMMTECESAQTGII